MIENYSHEKYKQPRGPWTAMPALIKVDEIRIKIKKCTINIGGYIQQEKCPVVARCNLRLCKSKNTEPCLLRIF